MPRGGYTLKGVPMSDASAGSRFARILFVGDRFLSAEDLKCRLVGVLRGAGHAVCCYSPADPNVDDAAALRSLYATFKPSLVLWDVRTSGIDEDAKSLLASWPCCNVALFDGEGGAADALSRDDGLFDFVLMPDGCQVLLPATARGRAVAFAPVPDGRYRDSVISDPDNVRCGLACSQVYDEARERQLFDAAAHGVKADDPGYVAINFSWPHNVYELHPNGCASFYLRTARYCVFFKDGQPTSVHDIALRDAEGLLVLVEEGQQIAAPDGFDDVLVRFAPGHLTEVVEALERDEEARDEALARQRRALGSLGSLEDGLQEALYAIEARTLAAGRPTVLPCSTPAARVVLFGWFGARNFGDDLLMKVVADRIERRYDNPHIRVIGGFPKVVYEEYGYESAAPHEKAKIADFLKGSSALVYCGGLVFDDSMAFTAGELEFLFDPWIEPAGQAGIALLARTNDVTPVFLGIGAGPVDVEATRKAVRLMGLAESVFLPRDEGARDCFVESGVPESQVRLKTDLVFGARAYIEAKAEDVPERLRDADYFVVALRRWHRNPPQFCEHVAQALDQVVEQTGLMPAFVPFDAEDVLVHEEVLGHMAHAQQAVQLDARPDEGEMLAILQGSRFSFAMRLHCSIIHHVLGKSAVGLNYNDKIEAHFAQMGRTQYLCELDEPPDAMARRAVEAIESGGLDDDACAVVERNRTLADEAFDELFAIIDAWRPPEPPREVHFPRTVSKIAQERELAEGRIRNAESALNEVRDRERRLSEELDEVQQTRGGKRALERVRAKRDRTRD